jgi:probable F420-dependent oxidoreductase
MAPADEARAATRRVEELGYGSLWFGEGPAYREAFVNAGLLLAASEGIVVGTGIANIHQRDPTSTKAAAFALAEAFPERFILGLGVSHRVVLESRGQDYGMPLTAMRNYLDAMERFTYEGALPEQAPATVLAALRAKMTALAGERASGAHSYLVPVEHTAHARSILGTDPLLVVELGFLIDQDRDSAMAQARDHMRWYLGQPNYANNLRELGYGDRDLADGGSDRLVDALVSYGSAESVAARTAEHLAAGADHVLLQPLNPTLQGGLEELTLLSPHLRELE